MKGKLTFGEDVPNEYNCVKAIWKKLSSSQKKVYNSLRTHSKDAILGGHAVEMTDGLFKTISHNYACLAAWQTPK